jgi:hypothetical protein
LPWSLLQADWVIQRLALPVSKGRSALQQRLRYRIVGKTLSAIFEVYRRLFHLSCSAWTSQLRWMK